MKIKNFDSEALAKGGVKKKKNKKNINKNPAKKNGRIK